MIVLMGFVFPLKGRASRGIWIMWDVGRVSVADSCAGTFSVSIKGALQGSGQAWVITCMYGPTLDSLIVQFLN